jgi:hypothetical protein
LRHVLKLLPLQGATAPTRETQGVASLALGYVFHWAFSPPLLNSKLESIYLTVAIFLPFILHCARLAVSLNKIRGGSAMQNESFLPFILHCARLAVSLHLNLRMS